MKIFQNYIAHIPTSVYEILIGEGILDGLKFPGTGASPDENSKFIDVVNSLKCLVDNHGWSGITGQLHDPHFADCISTFSELESYLNLPNAWNYSGHIGAATAKLPEGKLTKETFDEILLTNLSAIRETILRFTGKEPNICGEPIFPYYFDPQTTTPSFVNATLKSRGLQNGLDGLVLDICHSSVAAKFLETNVFFKNYSLEDYIKDLAIDQIKIIHISGSGNQAELLSHESIDFSKDKQLDPHIENTLAGFRTLQKVLKHCKNVQQVSNEFAYSGDYGIAATKFSYASEAIMTWVSAKKPSVFKEAYQIVARELDIDCSNLASIIAKCKAL